jgi:flotillin
VRLQTEVIKNIKIDKITVWDSGTGEKGSSTANFLSNLIKSLPALHDVAQMAGVELPNYLGSTTPDKKKEEEPKVIFKETKPTTEKPKGN